MKILLRKIKRKLKNIIKPDSGINIHDQVISLSSEPPLPAKGTVLVSYVIDPFLCKNEDEISQHHTHDWESYQMVKAFLDKGYHVDVISYLNRKFIPEKHYKYFISARTNLERIAKNLNSDCKVVAHLDTAHWILNNQAAYTRLLSLKERKGICLNNIKMVEANLAIENSDCATILGNEYTINSYKYANKPIYRIPISVPEVYHFDEQKDFGSARNHYLWFGSSGFVHKGLDLVLEAFEKLPDHKLTVCGPIDEEKEFVKAYHDHLYNMPNIHTYGWIDVKSPEFLEVCRNCIGLVYPTCAEGGGGSVITCMHAGLIPIISYESSVDIETNGIMLKENTIEEIQQSIIKLSNQSPDELYRLSKSTWEFVNNAHTRAIFVKTYNEFVTNTLGA